MPYRILPDNPAISCTPCLDSVLLNIRPNPNFYEYDPATCLGTGLIFFFYFSRAKVTLRCCLLHAWVQDELLVDWETKGGCKLQCSGSGSCSTDPDLDVILHLFIKNPLKFSAEHLKK